MIAVEENIFPIRKNDLPNKLLLLRQKVNDEDYLAEAVQRIAQVISNEITGTAGGGVLERKR
jgi:hypothetical protein